MRIVVSYMRVIIVHENCCVRYESCNAMIVHENCCGTAIVHENCCCGAAIVYDNCCGRKFHQTNEIECANELTEITEGCYVCAIPNLVEPLTAQEPPNLQKKLRRQLPPTQLQTRNYSIPTHSNQKLVGRNPFNKHLSTNTEKKKKKKQNQLTYNWLLSAAITQIISKQLNNGGSVCLIDVEAVSPLLSFCQPTISRKSMMNFFACQLRLMTKFCAKKKKYISIVHEKTLNE